MSETFGRASGSRKYSVVVLGLAILCCAVMVLSSLAAAGISFGSASPASSSAKVSPAASVAFGNPVSLDLIGETGAAIGASLVPSQPVALDQPDLVVVNLPLQNSAQVNAVLNAISDPNSPSYDHFLTAQQFDQEFAPPAAEQQAIVDYLTSAGLTVTFVPSDHLSVSATGTLQQMEKAFSVQFATYAKGDQSFFAPTGSPSMPSTLAPWVQNVVGLTDYNFGVQPQVVYNSQLAGGVHPDQNNGPGVGWEDYPNVINYDFQLNQLWNATGNKSAGVQPSYPKGVVVGTGLWDLNTSALPPPEQYCPYSITDINDFFQGKTGTPYNMPSELPAPIDHAQYNVTGDPGTPPGTGDCTAANNLTGPNTATEELDFEMTIDQEWAGESAPGAYIEPTYVNAEGVTVLDSQLDDLESYVANSSMNGAIPYSLFSQSFGGGESNPGYNNYFKTMELAGVTVLAASGDDNGAAGFEGNGEAVCQTSSAPYSWDTQGALATGDDYPGSDPNVLSVGGTATTNESTPGNPGGALQGQTVWNWCPSFDSGASGGGAGGVSADWTEPSYQSAIPQVNKAMQWASEVSNTGNFSTGLPPSGCEGCDDVAAETPTARVFPDVAGPAADNTGFMGDQWVSGFGGTSFSSPSVAGAVASIVAFDGHKIGFFNPTLYTLEQEYLSGDFASLPFPVSPAYEVSNYSNAFFNGSGPHDIPGYNASAGWGLPLSYNIALLMGKPFISTNPQGPATVGTAYPVSAAIKDDRSLSYVNVTYLEPGATGWANASLSRTAGTAIDGTWGGSIPAPAQTGVLLYCVNGIDNGNGNSWSPYNQSAWVATGGKHTTPGAFGCTVPFKVNVHAPTVTTYTVKFTEVGLPAGLLWGVTLTSASGHHQTITKYTNVSQVLSFKEPNGVYTYSYAKVKGFYIRSCPSSCYTGSVTVNGATPATTVTDWTSFKYTVTFQETGLAHGTSWSVTIDGLTHTSTGTKMSFSIPNGTYPFTAAATGYTYTAAPPSPLTVHGASVTVRITFT
jgi:hypothetical protein